nr:MAG: hypothetical protein TU35_09875 [Thermoproteus sp. AZ2]
MATSFTNWSPTSFQFVGVENYQLLLRDPLFYTAFETNLIWLAINVPASMALGMLFALVVHQRGGQGV